MTIFLQIDLTILKILFSASLYLIYLIIHVNYSSDSVKREMYVTRLNMSQCNRLAFQSAVSAVDYFRLPLNHSWPITHPVLHCDKPLATVYQYNSCLILLVICNGVRYESHPINLILVALMQAACIYINNKSLQTLLCITHFVVLPLYTARQLCGITPPLYPLFLAATGNLCQFHHGTPCNFQKPPLTKFHCPPVILS